MTDPRTGRLAGKCALVTGASRGIGRAIAQRLASSTAIRTPGAARYIPEGYPTEDVAYLAETALALCSLPARERTGLVAHSLHFPLSQGLAVRSRDGRTPLPPPVIPAYAHPHIDPTGL